MWSALRAISGWRCLRGLQAVVRERRRRPLRGSWGYRSRLKRYVRARVLQCYALGLTGRHAVRVEHVRATVATGPRAFAGHPSRCAAHHEPGAVRVRVQVHERELKRAPSADTNRDVAVADCL